MRKKEKKYKKNLYFSPLIILLLNLRFFYLRQLNINLKNEDKNNLEKNL